MPENDQTRWVGIRPINPPENIPVTESSPLDSIKVEPKLATTEFKTLTEKRLPAISDLQAIKANIGDNVYDGSANCTVSHSLGSGTVGATELWVITNMVIYNETSLCDMIIQVKIDGVVRAVKNFNSFEPKIHGTWDGLLVLAEDDRIQFQWLLGGAADVVAGIWHGYTIGVY
jgi:hypothetical protein